MENIVLRDNEIELIPLVLENVPALFELTDKNRTYIREWLPWVDKTKTEDDTKEFVMMALKQQTDKSGIHFGIWSEGELVGVIGYHYINYANKKATIGYWLDEETQGKGVMTTACKLVIDYGFEKLDLNRVEISCAVGNDKSCAIPERLGFRQEGIIRQSEWLNDRFVDHKYYGLLKSEWYKE